MDNESGARRSLELRHVAPQILEPVELPRLLGEDVENGCSTCLTRKTYVIDSHAERRAALIAAALAAPLVVLTVLVMIAFEPLLELDAAVVSSWHGAVDGTGWEHFFDAVAVASQSAVINVTLVAIAAIFAYRRDIRTAIWVAVVAVVTQPSWVLFKHVVQRDRDIVGQLGGYWFPRDTRPGSPPLRVY